MKKIICMILTAFMIVSSLGTFVFASSSDAVSTTTNTIEFSDVDASTAEGEAIYKLVKAGVVNGNGDGTFTPKNGITRAELCKMINLTYKYTEKDATQFKDVKSTDWFADQVLIAKKAGYINGYEDGTFRGNKNITREEFCAIISRINGLYDLGISANVADKVSDWAVKYVDMVVTNQIMSLEDGNKFRATQPIKRGEVAVVVAMFLNENNETVEPEPEPENKPSNKPSGPSGPSGPSRPSNDSNDTDTTPSLTPEEIKEKNAEIVAELTSAKNDLSSNKNKFKGDELTIVNNILNVIAKIIDDADEYEIDYGTVLENYTDEITDTYALYDSLPETTQSAFKTKVADINSKTFDFLVKFFGISI